MTDDIKLPSPKFLYFEEIGELHEPGDYVPSDCAALYTADQVREAVRLNAQAVPQGWPRAAKDQRDQGWTLEYRFLERVTDLAAPRTEYSTSMEATEQVLIAALEVLAAAPAAPQQKGASNG